MGFCPEGAEQVSPNDALGPDIHETESPERAGHGHGDVPPFQGSWTAS